MIDNYPALERWAGYCAMDAPELPADPLDALQVQLYRWQVNKFGVQPNWAMALGIVEEMGELREATTAQLTEDAIGDVLVFSSQLLNNNRMSLGRAIYDANNILKWDNLIVSAGRLAQVILKREQKVRGMGDDAEFRRTLYNRIVNVFASVRGYTTDDYDLAETVTKVGRHVMERKGNMLPKKGN